MSLLSSMSIAAGSIQADDIALQVTGQNIANANTPGYLREQAILTPSTPQQIGTLELGTGVRVQSIQQVVNQFLEQQVRSAMSDASNTQTQASAYTNLETTMNSLNTGSTNSLLTSFFSSISNVLNQPGDVSTQELAVLQGSTLTQNINQLAGNVASMRSDLNNQVVGMAGQINTLVSQIAQLNQQIEGTGTGSSGSSPVGLSDQQNQDLQSLSQLINISTARQADGTVNVYCGGEYLVYGGTTRSVEAVLDGGTSGDGVNPATIEFSDTHSTLDATSGQLAGLMTARDQVLGGFETQLNSFASTLANEFNKIYSSGQGTTGYTTITSLNSVNSPSQSLAATGLPLSPTSGSFNIMVQNTATGQTNTSQINISLTGTGNDTTLNDVAAQINTVSGLSASINRQGQLTIATTGANEQFAFAQDSSGTLAALGINTFFTGSMAADLGVNSAVVNDPTKFAASSGGIGTDTQNAQTLAAFATQPLADQNGNTVSGIYSELLGNVTEASSVAQSQSTAAQSYQSTLQGQETSTSGVSIDQETINMLNYQESYTASAKFISTINQLLQVLVSL